MSVAVTEAPAPTPEATQATPTAEAVAPIAPEAGTPKVKDSVRFAQLSAKERKLNERAKAEQEKLAASQAELETRYSQVEAFEKAKASARLNPIAYLEAAGLTYSDVAEFVINDNKPPVDANVQALNERLDALQKQTSEEKRLAKEQEEKRTLEENLRKERAYFQNIDSFIKQRAETYELITLEEAYPLVHEVVQAHFASTQEILTAQQAADAVEDHLFEMAQKLAATKKIQAKASPPKGAPPQTNKSATQSKTLTNTNSASVVSLSSSKAESDRMARALAALEGRHS